MCRNLLIVCFRQMDSRLVRYTLIKLFVGNEMQGVARFFFYEHANCPDV